MDTRKEADTGRATTAVVMTGSAWSLGTLGLFLLFAPGETSGALGWDGGEVAASLAAAGLLAVAILDWAGRGAIYGGIYGRPIVLANLVLSTAGGLALLNAQLDRAEAVLLGWVPVALLGAIGVAFGLILFGRIGGPGRGGV